MWCFAFYGPRIGSFGRRPESPASGESSRQGASHRICGKSCFSHQGENTAVEGFGFYGVPEAPLRWHMSIDSVLVPPNSFENNAEAIGMRCRIILAVGNALAAIFLGPLLKSVCRTGASRPRPRMPPWKVSWPPCLGHAEGVGIRRRTL